MSDKSKKIYVYADWRELNAPVLMGYLYAQFIRGKEVFSFEFHNDWLRSKFALIIDPDLQLYSGRQYSNLGKEIFGVFLDSSPDRWGCQLIQRREGIRARHENRPPRHLLTSDYLLGLHDATRMGAIRYKTERTGDFLNEI